MAQHFRLSAASRTLSLKEIYKAGEDAAYGYFCKLRWPETGGKAFAHVATMTKPTTFQRSVNSSARHVTTRLALPVAQSLPLVRWNLPICWPL